ncbi:MAG: ribosome-associated translation inhibitor RaiA, partial [Xanthomonadales bacterium]|nr:ribosome-associated translation inhibitor RaiA [Xanthomonadales bacterium]
MQINITGHHVDVTPALRAYVTEKMQKLNRHFD